MKENSQLEIIEQNSNSLSHNFNRARQAEKEKKAKLLQGELDGKYGNTRCGFKRGVQN